MCTLENYGLSYIWEWGFNLSFLIPLVKYGPSHLPYSKSHLTKLALFITIVVAMIVITLVRIDRWTKYYFGPRIGQTQAEGKNHMCQGGLFKASPHYTVSSNVTHTRAYWTRHTFEAIEKNPKFNQTQKEEPKTHQRNSIHSTRLHIVKGTVRRRTHLNDIDLGFNFAWCMNNSLHLDSLECVPGPWNRNHLTFSTITRQRWKPRRITRRAVIYCSLLFVLYTIWLEMTVKQIIYILYVFIMFLWLNE